MSQTLFTDDFSSVNGTGLPTHNPVWVERTFASDIQGGKAKETAGAGGSSAGACYIPSLQLPAAYSVECVLNTGTGGSDFHGLVACRSDNSTADNNGYYLFPRQDAVNGNVRLYKRVAATWTVLEDITVPVFGDNEDHTLELIIDNRVTNRVIIAFDKKIIASSSDTALLSGDVGIGIGTGYPAGSDVSWDNFKVTSLVEPTTLGPAFIKRPWTKQPPAGTPIDWGNPLTRDLVFFGPRGPDGADVISSAVPTVYSTNGTVKVSYGTIGHLTGYIYDMEGASTTETDASGFSWGTGSANIPFASKLPSSGHTTMVFARLSGAQYDWNNIFGVNDTSTPWYQGSIVRSTSAETGLIRIQSADGSFDTGGTANIWGSAKYNVLQQIVSTTQNLGSSNRFVSYQDGVLATTSDGGTGHDFNVDFGTPQLTVGSHYPSTGADHVIGSMMAAAIWSRELSAAEVKSMYENPWQIFKPRNIFMGKPDALNQRLVVF